MAPTPSPDAYLVRIRSGLEVMGACDDIRADPACSEWQLVAGHGGQIPREDLSLLCLAGQTRPSWVGPGAVDLGDPPAEELLELARSSHQP